MTPYPRATVALQLHLGSRRLGYICQPADVLKAYASHIHMFHRSSFCSCCQLLACTTPPVLDMSESSWRIVNDDESEARASTPGEQTARASTPGERTIDDGDTSWAGETVSSFSILAPSVAGDASDLLGASTPGQPADEAEADARPHSWVLHQGMPKPPGMPPTTTLTHIPEDVQQAVQQAVHGPPLAVPHVESVAIASTLGSVATGPPHCPMAGRQPPVAAPKAWLDGLDGASTSSPPYAEPVLAAETQPPPPPGQPPAGQLQPPPPPGFAPVALVASAPVASAPMASASTPGVAVSTPGVVASAASASTLGDEAAASTLVMVEDIHVFRGQFSIKRAHAWLAEVRKDCALRGRESIDLSEDPRWREYICSHPQARLIIHTGVTHFEGRFCRGRECNAKQLGLPPPFGAHRFDFIVWRNDGSACRLHPSKAADALPVVGRLVDWVISPLSPGASPASPGDSTPGASTPGASTPGPSPLSIQQRQGGAMVNYSRTDIISSEEAIRHLYDRWSTCASSGHIPAQSHEDLLAIASTPGGWQWHRFLMGRPWGQTLFYEGVTSLVLLVRDDQPCLRVTTVVHPQPRHIVWHGVKCKLVA